MRHSYGLLLVAALALALSGCASKDFTINYAGQNTPNTTLQGSPPVHVVAKDARTQKDMAAAVKPTPGDHALSFLVFGPAYALVDADMEQSKTQDFVDEFRKAIEGRIIGGGGTISGADSVRVIEIAVRNIDLEFSGGFWKAHVAFVATATAGGAVVFEQSVSENAEAYNWLGESSGQKAINEAFTRAINALDLNKSLGRLGQEQ